MDKKKERELIHKYRRDGDKDALTELVEMLQPFVSYMVRRYPSPTGISQQERRQIAYEGLLQAIQRYDASCDVSIKTYAAYWIRARLSKETVKELGAGRTGTAVATQPSAFYRMRKIDACPLYSDIRDRDAAICRELKMRAQREEEARSYLLPVLSMDAVIYGTTDPEGPITMHETRPSEDLSADELLDIEWAENMASKMVERAMSSLTPRERYVIRSLYYGNMVTKAKVGRSLDISRERVRQIEVGALAKMREELTKQYGYDTISEVFDIPPRVGNSASV